MEGAIFANKENTIMQNDTTPWFGALRRWMRVQREISELVAMTPREKRDAQISDYDLRWR